MEAFQGSLQCLHRFSVLLDQYREDHDVVLSGVLMTLSHPFHQCLLKPFRASQTQKAQNLKGILVIAGGTFPFPGEYEYYA